MYISVCKWTGTVKQIIRIAEAIVLILFIYLKF